MVLEFEELGIRCSTRIRLKQIFVNLIVILCSYSASCYLVKGHAKPRFLNSPKNVTFYEGSLAVLPCTVQHLGTKTVGWRNKEDEYYLTIGEVVFAQEKRLSVDYSRRTDTITDCNLVIKDVNIKDAGIYECHISAVVPIRRLVKLTVIRKPIMSRPPIILTGTEYVENAQPIRLVCNASGIQHAPEDIDWFKNGQKIKGRMNNNIVITKFQSLVDKSITSELIIDRARTADAGVYVCRSTNLDVTSIRVHVLTANSSNVKRRTSAEMKARKQTGKDSSSGVVSHGSVVLGTISLIFLGSFLV